MVVKKPRKRIDDKIIDKVDNCVSSFLKQVGGLSNGYCTYAKGSLDIKHNITVSGFALTFNTPKNDQRTGEQIRKLSDVLAKKIIKILTPYDVDTIEFTPIHEEYGCYTTEIHYIKESRLCLWV